MTGRSGAGRLQRKPLGKKSFLAVATCLGVLHFAIMASGCSVATVPQSYASMAVAPAIHDFSLPAQGAGPFPAVILMPGCAGLLSNVRAQLDAHAAYLQQGGFATLILDSFGPRGLGGGRVCGSDRALEHARHYRLADAFRTLEWLDMQSEIDGSRVFLLGQSNGGSTAMRAAFESADQTVPGIRQRFRGIVAYYPWCGAFDGSPVVTPLLILAGGEDRWTPPRRCVNEGARRTNEPITVVVYDGAVHSFDLMSPIETYLGYRIGGHPSARADSMQRVLAFFRALAR